MIRDVWMSGDTSKILVFRSMQPTSCSRLLINRKRAMVKTVPATILVFESSIVDSDQKVKSFSAFHFAQATGTQTGKWVTNMHKSWSDILQSNFMLWGEARRREAIRGALNQLILLIMSLFHHRCLRYHLTKWICWNIHTHSAMMTLDWQVS